jgi:membrane-associated phospholipid phosphatase
MATAKAPLRIKPQARLLGVFVGLIAVFLLLLHYDAELMQWRLRIMPRELHGLFRQLVDGFRNFAQVLTVVVVIIVAARVDQRRKSIIVAILLAQLIAAIGYNAGKFTISRFRPFAALGELPPNFTSANTWIGWNPNIHRAEKYRSFPSGHSAGAFALAGVLVWFYPRLKITFWTLAMGCALSRWVDLMHWPSDCFVGAVLGYGGAWLALRLVENNAPPATAQS